MCSLFTHNFCARRMARHTCLIANDHSLITMENVLCLEFRMLYGEREYVQPFEAESSRMHFSEMCEEKFQFFATVQTRQTFLIQRYRLLSGKLYSYIKFKVVYRFVF